jgi:flagellar motor switch protein FliG
MLASVIGEQQAIEVMSHHESHLAVGPLALLSQTEPERVVPHLVDEHPQTVAALLAHMPPGEGARLLDALPVELRAEVAVRIATMGRVSPEAVSAAVAQVAARLRAAGSGGSAAVGGIPALVELLNRAEGSTEKLVLGTLADRDPELAEAVRARMFTFEDVIALDDRTLQTVLRSVEISELAMALRGIADDTDAVNKFTQNLSERAQAQLTEEMEVMGAVRATQVDAAQASLVRVVRELEANGSIVINRNSDELV